MLALLLPTYSTVSVSSHQSIYHTPAIPALTLPIEPSRSLSTRNPALINSVIALFNCTAGICGTTLQTTQDDSDRLRVPIPRATLCQ
jgi:hypothetical protein